MKKYALTLRIYHWLMSLVVFLMLGTVVVRNSLFEKYALAKEIREFLAAKSLRLGVDDSLELTQLILDKVWRFHYYFGVAFSILVFYRIILFFTPSGRGVWDGFVGFVTRKDKSANAFKYLLYMLFYLVSVVLALTGMLMYGMGESLSESSYETLESIHNGVINIVFLFIPIHLIGVVMGERGEDKGIVSDMINGGDKK